MKKAKQYCIALLFLGIAAAFTSPPACFAASSDDASIYFNAGTEKYLQGDFTSAVELLEKAQAADPANSKIKEFITKILLEAATQNHMNHNYRQAFEYLKKAQNIAPENQKVQEMYKLTSDLLTRSQEKTAPAADTKAADTVHSRPPEPYSEKAPANPGPKQKAPPVKEYAVAARQPQAAAVTVDNHFYERTARDYPFTLFTAAVAGAILFLAFFILYLKKAYELSGILKKLNESLNTVQQLHDEKNALIVDLEKTKERSKYEHQIAEQYQRELKDKNRLDEERLKMELEIRTRQIEEKIKAEISGKTSVKSGGQEGFLHQQQAKFLEYLGALPATDNASSPALESARERIALMAENLYEYAPAAAVDFLNKMARNTNPLIRANVIQALARVASVQTMEILFELYNDTDQRVKREVLKQLKQLDKKSTERTVNLEQYLHERIKSILDEEKEKGEWIF